MNATRLRISIDFEHNIAVRAIDESIDTEHSAIIEKDTKATLEVGSKWQFYIILPELDAKLVSGFRRHEVSCGHKRL